MEEWKHFSPMLRKRCKMKAKRRSPDPTNPFGNPCGFGLALQLLDGGFGATVSHLMVPELEQRSAMPARSAGRKMSKFSYFEQKVKIGHGRDQGSDLVSAEGASYRGPNPK